MVKHYTEPNRTLRHGRRWSLVVRVGSGLPWFQWRWWCRECHLVSIARRRVALTSRIRSSTAGHKADYIWSTEAYSRTIPPITACFISMSKGLEHSTVQTALETVQNQTLTSSTVSRIRTRPVLHKCWCY